MQTRPGARAITARIRRGATAVGAVTILVGTLLAIPAPANAVAANSFPPAPSPLSTSPSGGSGVHPLIEPDGSFYYVQYAGTDRYDVAAQLDRDVFDPGVPVIYIASGEKYPDALSAGPAAAKEQGGLLLVTHDSIPATTLDALNYLQPHKIVVVGGSATISDAVFTQLAGIQSSILRIGGADRYEVSRNIADYAYCGLAPDAPRSACVGGAESVFVATGSNFPDALAAGPAAGTANSPVLLVPGSSSDLDLATRESISRLGAHSAFIAGGLNTVSAGIEAALDEAFSQQVLRFGGQDRFAVAAAINASFFPGYHKFAFVASGSGFADALSGGPVAAAIGAPLFLARQYCYPQPSWDGIFNSSLDPDILILLGGLNSLGLGVSEQANECQ